MNFWQGFTIVTFVHLLAAASPGPDFALVTRQSLLHGRTAGVLTSLGISLGLAIHILYSAAGLAVVISHSVEWMVVVKLAGGSYLIYLGIKGLRAKHHSADDNQENMLATSNSALRMITTGFLLNLAIYGVWIMVLQMLWFASLACFFTNTAIRQRVVKLGHWIDRTFGVVMLALGLQVLNSIR
jgi:threonine/homoserine/homoserine lactone efflux protein